MGYGENFRLIIGSEIARLRKEKGITQKAFAAELGITSPYVSLFEAGKKPISDEQMSKILKILNVTEKQLLLGQLAYNQSKLSDTMVLIIDQMMNISKEESTILEGLLIACLAADDSVKIKLFSHFKDGLTTMPRIPIPTMLAIKKIKEMLKASENQHEPDESYGKSNQYNLK